MNIDNINSIISEYYDLDIHISHGYNTGVLAEKYGLIDPDDVESDSIILKRDVPTKVVNDLDLLRDFLNKMEDDFEKMREAVLGGE